MARLAAEDLRERDIQATRLIVSPLERTQQSAAPIAELLGLDPELDERVIEPWNTFAGKTMHGRYSALRRPMSWRHLVNPTKPSWGEPYQEIFERMWSAVEDARNKAQGHEAVMVSHQLPIVMVQRHVQGKRLAHANRNCDLASVTSLVFDGDSVVDWAYNTPAQHI